MQHIKHHGFGLLFALALLIGVFISAQPALAWNGTGTEEDPYQIATAEDLNTFADIVNGTDGQTQKTDACAVLVDDIVLEGENSPWTPIGSNTYQFNGSFDGGGFEISGLYINNGTSYQGLFGYVGSKGSVQNLTVSGSITAGNYVGGVVGNNQGNVSNCTNKVDVTASGESAMIGGVVGYNNGNVETCANLGAVDATDDDNGATIGGVVGNNDSNGSVSGCINSAAIIVSNSHASIIAGGVVGNNNGSVSGCGNEEKIAADNSTGPTVGGVAGRNLNMLRDCYNTGDVSASSLSANSAEVGGVVGDNSSGMYHNGMVQNCYNTGAVSTTASLGNIGGVVGQNRNTGSISSCYNIGAVDASGFIANVGGVVGYNLSSISDCYYLNDAAQSGVGRGTGTGASSLTVAQFAASTSFSGWDFNDTWTMGPISTENGDFIRPVLQNNREDLKGNGTEADPYQIPNLATLEYYRDQINAITTHDEYGDKHYVLTADIDLGGEKNEWTPIGTNSYPFTGTFDGQCYRITGLYISASSSGHQGFFGRVGLGGMVTNLSVAGEITGGRYVGGVAGYNLGTVSNCTSTVDISVSALTAPVGGVVGDNDSYGTVENCVNYGACSATGNSAYVGGVVGENSGTVRNCCNGETGSVTGNRYAGGVVGRNYQGSDQSRPANLLSGCYNTGTVRVNVTYSTGYAGGVAGWNDGGTVSSCYSIGTVTADTAGGNDAYAAGVVGRNSKTSGTINGAYYLEADGLPDIGSNEEGTVTNVAPKDPEAFASGEVAWLLQDAVGEDAGQVWGQQLSGESKDAYPVLTQDTGKAVYQVTFDYNYDGEAANSIQYFNAGVTLPTDGTREGYTFENWYMDGECTGNPVTTVPTENTQITLYAKWMLNTYTVTFDSNGGSAVASQTVAHGQTVSEPNSPHKGDSSFTGWYTDSGCTTRWDFATPVTGNLTLYAGWQAYTGDYNYPVTVEQPDNGTVTIAKEDQWANDGERITITVIPDDAYMLDTLTVTDRAGNEIDVTDNGDGTYTFTMPEGAVTIIATFVEDPNWEEPEEPATDVSEIFNDVPANHWAQAAIQYVYDNGLMTGVSDSEFAPEATTTRAMIVSMLARMENVTSAADAGFADVDASDWYATAVNWAAANGIVSGISDNTFAPNDPITREQLAAMLMKYAQYKDLDTTARADLSHYSDAENISSWANDVLSWAVAEGLLAGVTDDQLQPQAATTRAQTAAVFQRFLTAESLENK